MGILGSFLDLASCSLTSCVFASCGQSFGGHSSQVAGPKPCKLRFLCSEIEDCFNIFLTNCITKKNLRDHFIILRQRQNFIAYKINEFVSAEVQQNDCGLMETLFAIQYNLPKIKFIGFSQTFAIIKCPPC